MLQHRQDIHLANTQNRPQTAEISLTAEVCAHTKAVENIYNNYRAEFVAEQSVAAGRQKC